MVGSSLWHCMEADGRETGSKVGKQVIFLVFSLVCPMTVTAHCRPYAVVTEHWDNMMGRIQSGYLGI